MNKDIKIDRVGEKKYNYQGYLMEIIKYQSSYDIDVKFEDGNIHEHCKIEGE